MHESGTGEDSPADTTRRSLRPKHGYRWGRVLPGPKSIVGRATATVPAAPTPQQQAFRCILQPMNSIYGISGPYRVCTVAVTKSLVEKPVRTWTSPCSGARDCKSACELHVVLGGGPHRRCWQEMRLVQHSGGEDKIFHRLLRPLTLDVPQLLLQRDQTLLQVICRYVGLRAADKKQCRSATSYMCAQPGKVALTVNYSEV